MKIKAPIWKLAVMLVAFFALLIGGARLLSRASWIGNTEDLSLALHGIFILFYGVYLFSKSKRFENTKFVRVGSIMGSIGLLSLGISLMLDLAMRFAGF